MIRLRAGLRYIGGPTAVTWQGLLIAWVLSTTGFLAGTGPTNLSLAMRVGMITVATVAGFVPLIVARWWTGRQPVPRSRPFLMLSLFFLAAFIRGFILANMTVWTGIDERPRFAYRILAATPAIVLALAVTAIIVGSIREHSERLAELSRVNEALAEAQERIELDVAEDQALVVAQITGQLREELDDIDPGRPAESAQTLHRLSSDVVRPLSHQLAQSVPTWEPTAQATSAPRASLGAVIAQVSQGEPFLELPTAAALPAVGLGSLLSVLSPALSVATLIAIFGVTVVQLVVSNVLINAIPAAWPRWCRPAGFIVSVVVFAGVTALFLYASVPESPIRIRLTVGGLWIALMFVVLFALLKAYGELQAQSEESLREQNEQLRWSVVRARQTQWYQQRAFARVLHGPVQTTLNAAAIRLDVALREQQNVAPIIENARAELRSVLADVAVERGRPTSLDDAITRIIALWSGLCTVEIDVEPEAKAALDGDDVCRMMLSELLTEGASNAVNHGNATSLHTWVALDGDVIDVVMTDNGTVPPARVEAGLGSRMLNECAIRWSRDLTDNGTTLRAQLPVLVDVS